MRRPLPLQLRQLFMGRQTVAPPLQRWLQRAEHAASRKARREGRPSGKDICPKHLRDNLLAHRLNHAKRKKRLATQAKEFRELLAQLRPTQRGNMVLSKSANGAFEGGDCQPRAMCW